ncbi:MULTISPECIES: FMN reductase [Nocardiopsis]|uniref:FMN reductase n=2 Tax=Nocardiopsis alba TaxID=53437 RepID=A0A7K2J0V3_9ACTN|nr:MULTISPECIES: FMN reductase [Nocardiopsis]AFR09020.1 LLM-partnered FMN reductase, CE1759 family protein [Nocardiopsis alba ATCC BAA-2165]MEC3890915.1 FMN reductase [Nocardiopsis sp. LDBS1602]MYR35717.1 NADPH-dependent FMN reductase [Nocardiopsis alba]
MTRKLVTVTAGLSNPSSTRLLADRLTNATEEALAERGETVDVRVVELREVAHDIMNAMTTRVPTGDLSGILKDMDEADAVIAVTPVFNASYSGLFKSFFDVVEPGTLDGTPVLAAATGGSPRHSLVLEHALRPMFSYSRAVVVPTGVYAASEDWGAGESGGRELSERIARAARQLALLATEHSAKTEDPYEEPTPFADLMSGLGT